MSLEAASSSEPSFALAREGGWKDEFWLLLVGSVDVVLRSYYGIYEFTDDPACVFRIGLGPAREPVTLSDGTEIGGGEPVGALHLWNEHLRQYSNGGPDLGWACDMRRRVVRSLQLLAEYVEREPEWHGVQAFYGQGTLSPRLGNVQIRRLAERFGFERVEAPPSPSRQFHSLADCFSAWALTRAFNPAALGRQGFLRARCGLWITRRVLIDRYGSEARPPRFTRAPRR